MVEHTQKGTEKEEMSNYDQTREPLQPNNIVLNCGIIAGWASFIRKCPDAFDPRDVAAEQYIQRGQALVRDIIQGTPGTQVALFPCDVADNLVAAKIMAYIPFTLQRGSARDRGVPQALTQIAERLTDEFPA
jgi:hypothetical protein